ncbi:MAG: TonB-dependent receptor plug domain-containing protein [Opitutaceae bacterium]|nr:TonB-dependent receptor plug domain-containing protein [Opitutaceae bacterium]
MNCFVRCSLSSRAGLLRRRARVGAAVASLVSFFSGFAQSAAPSPSAATAAAEEAVVLSPFTVSVAEDKGYAATSTLAGTRLKTKIADIGASLSVITTEFLADTGVKNVNELFTYTLGTEAGGPEGNFAGGASAGSGAENLQGIGTVRRSPQSATRVRGIGSADITRNYFLTEIPFDSYNVERVEISRGPNAILFGLGSAAGIVNYGLIKPTFQPHTTLAAEFARFGSYRGTLDTNWVLIPGKLALRFAGLHSDQQFEQEPTFERDSRGFLAALYRPLARTTLRADVEFGRIAANRPNYTSPIDNISVWMKSARPTWDASTDNFALVPPVLFSQQFFWQWATIWDQPNASAPTANGVQGRRNAPAPVRQWVGGANLAEVPGNGSYRLQGFTDLSVYDFRKNLLAGNTGGVHTDFDSIGASLEQSLLDGQTGFELAFNRQRYSDESFDPIGAQESYRIWVDLNTRYLDGRGNPNFGRPYVMATPQKGESRTERESVRATAFYEFDFKRRSSGRLAPWLGRHTLTGLLDRQEIDQRSINWRMGWVGAGAANRVNENLNGVLNNFRRRVQNVIYLGPSVASAASISNVRISGYPTAPVWQPGAIYPITGFDIQTQAWTTQQAQEFAQPFGGAANRQEIDSAAVVLKSNWLKDHLVTMAGWRRDRSDSFQLAPIPTDLEGSVLLNRLAPPSAATSTVDEKVWSYSAVARLPLKLPLRSGLSVHYSQSENFQPLAARVNIFGDSISSPGGKSKEYGFTLAMLDDKVNFRVNWYDAKVLNESSPDASNLAWNIVINQAEFVALNYLYEDKQAGLVTQAQIDAFGLPPEATRKFVSATFVTLPNGQGQWTYRIPGGTASSASDRTAKGFEVDGIVNPTPRWRIALNVGKQETMTTGAAADVARYIAQRQTAWRSVYNLPRGPGSPAFSAWYEPVVMIPSRTIASQDGRISPEQRKWRANLVTNYEFGSDASWLKGAGVGGAVRWQDKVAIGYPLKTNPDGQLVSDIDRPFFGPTELNVDVWTSYRIPLKWTKAAWTARLALRNVIRERALIPISTQPDGSLAQVRVAPPLIWEFRNSIEF